MFKKLLLITLFTLGIGLLFSSKAYAAVDITLENNPEENLVEVDINSNNEMLSGASIDIFFSNGLVVEEIIETGNFCSMGFNAVASNGIVSIECLNDEGSVLNGNLATISYTAEDEDYFFYLDESSVDFGNNELGSVININKPEDISIDNSDGLDSDIVTDQDNSIVQKIVTFTSEYYTYISIAIILIVTVLLISVFKRS